MLTISLLKCCTFVYFSSHIYCGKALFLKSTSKCFKTASPELSKIKSYLVRVCHIAVLEIWSTLLCGRKHVSFIADCYTASGQKLESRTNSSHTRYQKISIEHLAAQTIHLAHKFTCGQQQLPLHCRQMLKGNKEF